MKQVYFYVQAPNDFATVAKAEELNDRMLEYVEKGVDLATVVIRAHIIED
jgi:hypothetical protein